MGSIRLIAEYTTAEGPFVDDYFLVFMTAQEDGGHEASFYAEGARETLAALSVALGASIDNGLCDSAHYKTRILWPERLKGQPLMDILPPSTRTWWRRLLNPGERDLRLSAAARTAFE